MFDFEINPWEFFKNNDIKKLQKKYHPDFYKDGGDAFIRLQAAFERSKSKLLSIGKYPLYMHITRGDLRDVYLTDGAIIKVPTKRNTQISKLIKNEVDTVNKLREDRFLCKYIPEIIDFVDDSIVIENSGNTLQFIQSKVDLDDRHIVWMLNRCLECMTFVHAKGYCHNALSVNHVIFNTNTHGGSICGWIHSKPIGEMIGVVPSLLVNTYPKWANKTSSIKLDLFMLSKCFSPKNGRLRTFVNNLDVFDTAFEAIKSLKELAENLFGKPTFLKLEI